MNHVVQPKLRHANKKNVPFNKLVKYIEADKAFEKLPLISNEFDNLLDYATANVDKETELEKCIAIRTHAIHDIATASMEMNAVANQNPRCKDPTFHMVTTWRARERGILTTESMFDAVEHAIKSLGLAEHQYVIAIHANTDNLHCHIAINRINPKTYRSHNIEWAYKTLSMAARQSELKHGWMHDNGIYIVEKDGHGNKRIVLNPDLSQHNIQPLGYAHTEPDPELETEQLLPAWHDPESLDSWLKSTVARELKRALPTLQSWDGLHAWLANHGISISNTGGGGMRLRAASSATGEILDLPASKGLRMLKRSELEKRWGPFADALPHPCIVPDLSHLTRNQLEKGVAHVLRTSFDKGIPPDHIIHAIENRSGHAAHRARGLHELSAGGLDAGRQDREMLLPDSLPLHLGIEQAGQDQGMRRAGTGEASSRSERTLSRDNSKREERRLQRAAARADLRSRFAKYQRFVREGDSDHWLRVKEIKAERSLGLKAVRERTKESIANLRNGSEYIATMIVSIKAEDLRQKLQIETDFQTKFQSLNSTRLPPLGWRVWLYEQANLGDQAALSALRGIVYQAQRDAKRTTSSSQDNEEEIAANADDARERQFRKLMARLLEEEQQDIAIRSAQYNEMRPYEADALLARYTGIQWLVTGNGDIEYSDQAGGHLFTDRGNLVTFDRALVTDEEIRLALFHAQQKFGNPLLLTGDDLIFSERMARLADDMGMQILNPELQSAVNDHRKVRIPEIAKQQIPIPLVEIKPELPAAKVPEEHQEVLQPVPPVLSEPYERLKAKVLSIDPQAVFVIPDPLDVNHSYSGVVVATLDENAGFAQHTGRRIYALHLAILPEHNDVAVDVKYRNGLAVVTNSNRPKGKDF